MCAPTQLHALALQELLEVHHLPSDNLAAWHYKEDVAALELKPQGTPEGPIASRTRNRGAIPLPAFARRKRRKKAAPQVRSLCRSSLAFFVNNHKPQLFIVWAASSSMHSCDVAFVLLLWSCMLS